MAEQGVFMKRMVFLHPFLFAAYFVAELYAVNINRVHYRDVLKPLLAVLLLTGLYLYLLYRRIKEENRAAFLSSITVIFLLYFGFISNGLIPKTEIELLTNCREAFFIVWIFGFCFLGSRWLWDRFKTPHFLSMTLNIVSLVAVILPFSLIGYYFYHRAEIFIPRQIDVSIDPTRTLSLQCSHCPDIYYIIVDGYGRADILEKIYNFDNRELITYLEDKGFYIANKSHSNYIETYISLTSSLNFSYLDNFSSIMGIPSRFDQFTQFLQHSRARSLLEESGYRFIAFSTGFSLTEVPDADLFLSIYPETGITVPLTDFDRLLLSMTIFDIPIQWIQASHPLPVLSYDAHRDRILFTLEKLTEIPKMPGSNLVYAHIVAPHPPFVFDENGEPVENSRPYAILDGSDFKGSTQEYLDGYIRQVMFLNQKLEETINTILSDSLDPPIIILQGDHGPGAFLNWDSMERSCIPERISILNAYYFPNARYEFLYPSISPVNSFRVLFNTFFGTSYQLLDDRSYYSSWKQPQTLIDITAETGNWESCSSTIKE